MIFSSNKQPNGALLDTRTVFLDTQLSRKSPAHPPSRAATSNIKNLTAFHPRRPRIEGRVATTHLTPSRLRTRWAVTDRVLIINTIFLGGDLSRRDGSLLAKGESGGEDGAGCEEVRKARV